MEYIIIDDNQDFAKALCVHLSKNEENTICNKAEIVFFEENSEVNELADRVNLNDDSLIFINVNLKLNKFNRQDRKGIELLIWLRIKDVMNHVVLYSFESLETILKKPENLIITSRGTSFVRLPSDFIEFKNAETLITNKKNIQWALKEAYTKELDHAQTNNFYIENVWKPLIEPIEKVTKVHSLLNAIAKYLVGHSEKINNDLIEKIFALKEEIQSYGIEELEVTVALCDDHSIKEIFKIGEKIINKNYIIQKNLDHFGLKETFSIELCESLDGLYELKTDCDIILLDYKLGKEETGTQYFIDRKKNIVKEKHQFLGKNWVLPISYMSDEMVEDFRKNYVAFTENDLVLSLGADPISQPYRFLYELLFILNEQLKRAIGWTIKENFENGFLYKAGKLIEDIKKETDENKKAKNKTNWVLGFSEVSTLFHRIHTINQNIERGGLYQSLNKKLVEPTVKRKIEILSLYRDLLYQLSFMKHEDNELLFLLMMDLESCLEEYKLTNS
jgi:hypothetical protein